MLRSEVNRLKEKNNLFFSETEWTESLVRKNLKEKTYIAPTKIEDLSVGDKVIVIDYDRENPNLDSGYYYIGKTGYVDSWDGESSKPEIITLKDEALFIENFIVKKVI